MNENNRVSIRILGSCAGTEPYPFRHHTSVAMTVGDDVYFLDAGENCSYTAHLCGIDLLKVKAIFISHNHMDHIGGLANLLWTIRKMCWVTGKLPDADTIRVFMPHIEAYRGIMKLLSYTEDNFHCDYGHRVTKLKEGSVYKGKEFELIAVGNHHLPYDDKGQPTSFSFIVRAGGYNVFYSGDTTLDDLKENVPEECDYLFMETGHHEIKDVCRCLKDTGKKIKNLVMMHHGPHVMSDPEMAMVDLNKYWGDNAILSEDGMKIL